MRIKVSQQITQMVHEHCAQKLTMLNEDGDLQRKISGQILNRNQKWDSSVGISNLFPGGTQNHLISYQSFSRPLLQQNQCTHMMGKDELTQLTNRVFEHYNIEIDFSPLSVFEYLLEHYDNAIQIDSWERLADFMDGV